MVLRDDKDQIIDAYFSASCGGTTANLEITLGRSRARSTLRGVRDDYCHAGSHSHWTDVIPAFDSLPRSQRSADRRRRNIRELIVPGAIKPDGPKLSITGRENDDR